MMRRLATRLREAGDSGLSLIELIVAIVVSSIVLIAIGTILATSWLAQSQVLTTNEATNRGQLISSSVEKAMRNALYFETRNAGTELWVRTSFTDNRQCQAFHLSDGLAQMKSSESALESVAWGTWVAEDDGRSWQALVAAEGTIPFFSAVDTTVTYTFNILDPETDTAPVKFVGEVSARSEGTWGSDPCW